MNNIDELTKYCRKLQRRVYILEQAVQALLERDDGYLEQFPPFNNQAIRTKIFRSIIENLDIDLIAETGTKWGATTAFLAKSFDGPVFSSELLRESFLIASERLKHYQNVKIYQLDSRLFLKTLFETEVERVTCPLFYLDAHWYDDLPLLDEVNLISEQFDNFIILVDDFKVPNDPGYGFDDYGDSNVLHLPYLSSAVDKHSLDVFFPSIPSSQETGAKRGCCVLTRKNTQIAKVLVDLDILKKYKSQSVKKSF